VTPHAGTEPPPPIVHRAAAVHIVSGGFGACHDSAAREIGHRVRAVGHEVRLHHVVDVFPVGLGRALRVSHLWQLHALSGCWPAPLSTRDSNGPGLRQAGRSLRMAAGGLVEVTQGADVVVSTHPFASQVLGERRPRGTRRVPGLTYLIDASRRFAGHRAASSRRPRAGWTLG
jgi:processive 1,2-diacylglycerol beta-glucosyltransferase